MFNRDVNVRNIYILLYSKLTFNKFIEKSLNDQSKITIRIIETERNKHKLVSQVRLLDGIGYNEASR